VIGFGFTLFGLGILAYVLGRYFLQGNPVPGFPFLASVIAIFSGAQLFALGIIGEYLARIHFRMMEKPTYTVREQLANQTASEPAMGRSSNGSSSAITVKKQIGRK
jgi:undecaprenyl-phosphate 4-deoxy-4-formamido-L-arabinose transferase